MSGKHAPKLFADKPISGKSAGMPIAMFVCSTLIALGSAVLLWSTNAANGLYGPSPAGVFLLLSWIVAALFNLAGISYAGNLSDPGRRRTLTLLNAVLPGLLLILFALTSLGVFRAA